MSSSSDEDDDFDAAKFASVAIDSSAVILNASAPVTSLRKSADTRDSDEDESKDHGSGLKLYQTRLQDLLHKHLDKTLGDKCRSVPPPPRNETVDDSGRTGGGIRLFRRAPPGIVVPLREEKLYGPGIKPQLRPSLTLDEDSDEHLVRLQATAVDGHTVAEQAKQLRDRALASAKSSQAKAELTRKKEDERVAELKRQRGEEWLPSVAIQIAKEIAKEPKLPKAAVPATVLAPEETKTDAPPKKKKRKKKISKAQLGIVVD